MTIFNDEQFRQHLLDLQNETGVELGPNRVTIGRRSFPSIGNEFVIGDMLGSPVDRISGMVFRIPHESGAHSRVRVGKSAVTGKASAGIETHIGPNGSWPASFRHTVGILNSPDELLSAYDAQVHELEESLRKGAKVSDIERDHTMRIHHASTRMDTGREEPGEFGGQWDVYPNSSTVQVLGRGMFNPSRNFHFRRNT